MIVAIEGMDGSGKSTVALRLANQHQYEYISYPIKNFFNFDSKTFDAICDKVYEAKDTRTKAWFFALGNLLTIVENPNKNLVIDRHNYFWNGDQKTDGIFKELVSTIPLPDLTIILYAGVQTRIERLKKRNKQDPDLFDTEKMVLGYDKMIEYADKIGMPYLIVNTEKLNMEQVFYVCNKIFEKIKGKTPAEIARMCKRYSNII